MVVDHEIRVITVPIGAGLSTSRFGIFENGTLLDCVYEYESAKMLVRNRKDIWADHGE